jgi:hypothetical protein
MWMISVAANSAKLNNAKDTRLQCVAFTPCRSD